MKSSQLTVLCPLYHVLWGWAPRWRGMNRELKLTCKMSGFRSQKVKSGAQIVRAVKAGTPHVWACVMEGAEAEGQRNILMHQFLCSQWAPSKILWLRALQRRFTGGGLLLEFSPASLGEHDNCAGAALEGSLHGTDSDGLCGVTGQMRGATQLLEDLPVEHGCLSFTGNLKMWEQKL